MDYTKKKLMFISGSLTGGGAEHVMAILASQCAELGAEVSLVVLREKERAYAVSDKVHCYQVKASKGTFQVLSRIRQLHKIIKESSVDVLIPFLPIITLYTMIANIGIGKRLIASERANPNVGLFAPNMNIKDRIGNLLMRRLGLFRYADWMVFQTTDAQSWYPKAVQEKSCIIPNPLDTERLPMRYEGDRDKLIVAAGRFSEEKNFPMLIKGFAKFHKKYPEYRLRIYGEGKLRSQYERQIQELALEQYVDMPGFSKNLSNAINRAAMYVSTSNHEGISNSMLEALGMGIPTIVTDCPVGGARMFVKTDVNGILISMENVEELVCAMDRIASDAVYAREISLNAEKIRYELEAKNIAKQWLELV